MPSRKKTVRNTKRGSNAVGIQKKINSDYEVLARDYGKLFVEIWRKPATKWVLGGVALSAILPSALRYLDRNTEIRSLVRGNIDGLRDRVEGVISSREVRDLDSLS